MTLQNADRRGSCLRPSCTARRGWSNPRDRDAASMGKRVECPDLTPRGRGRGRSDVRSAETLAVGYGGDRLERGRHGRLDGGAEKGPLAADGCTAFGGERLFQIVEQRMQASDHLG